MPEFTHGMPDLPFFLICSLPQLLHLANTVRLMRSTPVLSILQ